MKNLLQIFVLLLFLIPLSNSFASGKDDLYKPFAEVMPEPKGGIEGVYSKIQYPKAAQQVGIQGKYIF